MKNNNLNKTAGKLLVKGGVKWDRKFSISVETENGYIIGISENFKPNWFQRLLYRIMGFDVIKL